jgi:hypothetical protein
VIRAQQQQQQQQRQAAKKAGPTTQDLLNGPKKHLRLAGMPFSMDVPSSWDLQSLADGALITLTGPATSGEINIQLVAQSGQALPAAPNQRRPGQTRARKSTPSRTRSTASS